MTMETNILDTIKTRRSCRKYTTEQISDDELNQVIEAGLMRRQDTDSKTLSSWLCKTKR